LSFEKKHYAIKNTVVQIIKVCQQELNKKRESFEHKACEICIALK